MVLAADHPVRALGRQRLADPGADRPLADRHRRHHVAELRPAERPAAEPARCRLAMAFLVVGGNVFGLMAPIVTGYVIAVTGSYDMAFVIAGVLLVIGATSILTLTRRPIGRRCWQPVRASSRATSRTDLRRHHVRLEHPHTPPLTLWPVDAAPSSAAWPPCCRPSVQAAARSSPQPSAGQRGTLSPMSAAARPRSATRGARASGCSASTLRRTRGRTVQLVTDLVNPSFLAFDRQQRFLYAVHGDLSEISAFRIDPQTRRAHLPEPAIHRGPATRPTLWSTASNRFVHRRQLCHGHPGRPAPPEPTARSVPCSSSCSYPGDAGTATRSTRPPRIRTRSPIDRDGRFLIVPDKGLDRIFTFRFDAGQGRAWPATAPSCRSGPAPGRGTSCSIRPRHSPSWRMSSMPRSAPTATTPQSGALDPVTGDPLGAGQFTGANTAAEIAISPSGRFVFVSNRGHDSVGSFASTRRAGGCARSAGRRAKARGRASSPSILRRDPATRPTRTATASCRSGSTPQPGALDPRRRRDPTGQPGLHRVFLAGPEEKQG